MLTANPRLRLRLPFAILAATVLAGPFALLSAAEKKETKAAAVLERLKSDMKFLSSDELEGRGVGTKGLNKAAEFVREQFRKAGLDVTRVKGGAYHTFKMATGTKLGKTNTLTFIEKDGKKVDLKIEKDFRTCSFGRSGKFNGGIVFLGYGVDAPGLKYSDYKGVDLKGKVAIIMRRTPQQGNPHSAFNRGRNRANYGALSRKYRDAFAKGAAAVLFVNDPYTTKREAERRAKLVQRAKDNIVKAAEALETAETAKKKDPKTIAAARKKLSATLSRLNAVRRVIGGNVDELFKFGYGGNTSRSKTPRPIFQITQATCNRLLKSAFKKTLQDFEAEIAKDLKPRSIAAKSWSAKGEASVILEEQDVKNVIGVLEGKGPLANETIVIGAHYDHVGWGKYGSRTPGEIHNGADDNASGTVALIELARRLASRKKKLQRRVVFIAFTAEELGLIGSAKYAEKPVFPLKNTVAMFNMDMVGRLQQGKLTIFCTGSSPRWKPLLEKYGKSKFKLALRGEMFGRSDHASFARKNIPAIHFFTNSHSDYHKPSDDWQKINFKGMADVVDLVESVVVETVETKARPKFTKPPVPKRKRRTTGRWPYFGSQPDYAKKVDGLFINGATKGSPADEAGLKKDDIIVKFGKYKITGINDYADALTRFKNGDTVELQVKRGGKIVKLKATLGRKR